MEDHTFGNLIAWLAIAIVLMYCFTTPASGYSERVTYVLIMEPCDLETVEYVESQIAVKTGYEEYLTTSFIVTCFFGADMKTLDKVSVPLLRQAFPDDYLMFLFPPSDLQDFRSLVGRNGHGAGDSQGYALIEYGYALAVLNKSPQMPWDTVAYLVDHEVLHCVLCAYHNRESDDPRDWYRPRFASIRGPQWCAIRGELVDLTAGN